MPTKTTLATVPIPERLATRPRDPRGFPVPYATTRNGDDAYDFTTNDLQTWYEIMSRELCGLCGQRMTYWKWFIGGPQAHKNLVCSDPHMHEECARYAVQVCPYLAAPRARRREPREGSVAAPGSVKERPDRVALIRARSCTVMRYPGSAPLIQIKGYASVEWWRTGVRITEDGAPYAPEPPPSTTLTQGDPSPLPAIVITVCDTDYQPDSDHERPIEDPRDE